MCGEFMGVGGPNLEKQNIRITLHAAQLLELVKQEANAIRQKAASNALSRPTRSPWEIRTSRLTHYFLWDLKSLHPKHKQDLIPFSRFCTLKPSKAA